MRQSFLIYHCFVIRKGVVVVISEVAVVLQRIVGDRGTGVIIDKGAAVHRRPIARCHTEEEGRIIGVAAVHLRQIVFDVVFVQVFRDIGKTVSGGIDLIKSGRIDQSVQLFGLRKRLPAARRRGRDFHQVVVIDRVTGIT